MNLWNAKIVLRQLSLFFFIGNVVNSPSFDISHSNTRHILHAQLHIVTRLSYNILLITAAYLCIPLITLVYL